MVLNGLLRHFEGESEDMSDEAREEVHGAWDNSVPESGIGPTKTLPQERPEVGENENGNGEDMIWYQIGAPLVGFAA